MQNRVKKEKKFSRSTKNRFLCSQNMVDHKPKASIDGSSVQKGGNKQK